MLDSPDATLPKLVLQGPDDLKHNHLHRQAERDTADDSILEVLLSFPIQDSTHLYM